VQEDMQRLIELQKLDVSIRDMTLQKATREKELSELESEQARIEEMVNELQEKVAALESECRELDQALLRERDNMKRAEERLPAIKTQKEYVAVLKEIDTAKKFEKEIGERIEAKKGETASYTSDRDEKVAELDGLKAKAAERLAAIRSEGAELDAQLTSQQAAREELFKAVAKPLQRKYQLLLERRGGLAVVQASQGACLGCNMHLPPQMYNSLMRVADIQSCPHCNRLIYVAEEG